ncbi:MAG TPA: hypothetical protein VLX28_02650, partial [Thermoanaerobaculia bacterium]|nr:hypothetical protein [Thermoanaerobaculia bacterium]
PVRPLRGVLCLLFFYGSLAAAVAQEDPVQAAREGLALIPQGNSARLELPGGQALSLILPERAEVSSLAATDGGWVAAGSFPDAAGRQRLFLRTGDDKNFRELPEPPGQAFSQRRGPVLLVDGGRLAGLAWLEGDGLRSLAVRAAAWNGRKWQAPQIVSHPGPGSQLALTGAVLADGAWLLAWSAFDGTADEIVWSERVGSAWLPVSRLSTPNQVPDITPALTSTAGGGALIAWSRFDGHGYQMRMARFERGAWVDEHAAGPSGSLYPAFLGASDRPRLLYLEAAARSWSVLDLDAAGKVLAKASLSSPSRSLSRPVVDSVAGSVRLRWPAEKQQGTATLERVP